MTMRRSRYSGSASLLVALLCAASCLVAVPARLLEKHEDELVLEDNNKVRKKDNG
jgi:hypothetical protein